MSILAQGILGSRNLFATPCDFWRGGVRKSLRRTGRRRRVAAIVGRAYCVSP